MGYCLVVPPRLASGGIHRDYAVCVEVVTGAHRAIEIGRGIADREEEQVQLLVVGGRHPDAASALLPGIRVLRAVCLLASDVAVQVGIFGLRRPGAPPPVGGYRVLAGCGDRIPAPHHSPGGHVEGVEVTTDAVLAARDAYYHVLANYQRGRGDAVARVDRGDLGIPCLLPGSRIECDDMRIQGTEEHLAIRYGDSPVVRAAAEHRRSQLVREAPELLRLGDVVRDHRVIVGCRDVHRVAGNYRRVLEGSGLGAGLEHHPRHEGADVLLGDLARGRPPLSPVAAAVRGPVGLRVRDGWRARKKECAEHQTAPPRDTASIS